LDAILDIYNFLTIYDKFANPSGQDKTIFLKLSLKFASKMRKQKKNHCFFKNYEFHLLQGVLNAVKNLYGSFCIIYFTRIQ